jgi:hypothetical protein
MDRGERLRLDVQRAAIEIAQLPVLGQCVEQDRVVQVLAQLLQNSPVENVTRQKASGEGA